MFLMEDESSQTFRSYMCSSSLVSKIIFMKSHPETHPYLQPYSTSGWCQECEGKRDIKAIMSILQIVYEENLKTLWNKAFTRTWKKWIWQGQQCQLRDFLGQEQQSGSASILLLGSSNSVFVLKTLCIWWLQSVLRVICDKVHWGDRYHLNIHGSYTLAKQRFSIALLNCFNGIDIMGRRNIYVKVES